MVEQELKNSDIIQLGDVEMLYDCEDKDSSTDKTSNITGISLNVNPTSSSSIKKMETISQYSGNRKDNRKNQKIIFIIIGVLVLAVLGLLGYVGFRML